MSSPYELLAGLALLREKKRSAFQRHDQELQEWSGFQVRIGSLACLVPCEPVEEVMSQGVAAVARGVPAWVRGVGYFRAQLVTLVDVAALLLGEVKAPGSATRIFVMRGQREWFGLQVSVFEGVRHIWSDTQAVAAPQGLEAGWTRYVRQWLLLEGETVAVLDVSKLVAALENGEVH
jgi:chemotaxis signal transduction protein